MPSAKGKPARHAAASGKPGRPSHYKPEFAKVAEKMCDMGATEQDLAEAFGVNRRTITNWELTHPEFAVALRVGKERADNRVERSFYHLAVGWSHEAVKIFMPAGAKAPIYAPYIERFAPDERAGRFWLMNRRPDAWRASRNDQGGDDGGGIVVKGGLPDGD